LSTILYALCLDPLICTINNALRGIKIGRRTTTTSVIAYADDVNIFLKSPSDVPKLEEAITCYEKASSAKINIRKSKAMGSWAKDLPISNIPYHNTTRILGMEIRESLRKTSIASWNRTTTLIKAQAMEEYSRALTFAQIIQYIHEYLCARAW
jgi:hypothetical protein